MSPDVMPASRLLLALVGLTALAGPALADKIKNPTAVFSGLDKITGRIIAFEAAVDETVQFGSLQLTARVCYSRPEYENPQTTTFVEVEEVSSDNQYKRLFSGWMFASSPGLNAIEHAVYDIWLTECKGGSEIIKSPPDLEVEEAPPLPQTAARQPAKPAQPINPNTRSTAPNAANAPLRLPGSDGLRPPADLRPAPQQRFFPTNTPINRPDPVLNTNR